MSDKNKKMIWLAIYKKSTLENNDYNYFELDFLYKFFSLELCYYKNFLLYWQPIN